MAPHVRRMEAYSVFREVDDGTMATVIKAGRVIPSGTTVQHTEFNLQDMSQQASQYLEDVKSKAAQIVKQAQQQAEAIHQQAAEKGRETASAAAQQAARMKRPDAGPRWPQLSNKPLTLPLNYVPVGSRTGKII